MPQQGRFRALVSLVSFFTWSALATAQEEASPAPSQGVVLPPGWHEEACIETPLLKQTDDGDRLKVFSSPEELGDGRVVFGVSHDRLGIYDPSRHDLKILQFKNRSKKGDPISYATPKEIKPGVVALPVEGEVLIMKLPERTPAPGTHGSISETQVTPDQVLLAADGEKIHATPVKVGNRWLAIYENGEVYDLLADTKSSDGRQVPLLKLNDNISATPLLMKNGNLFVAGRERFYVLDPAILKSTEVATLRDLKKERNANKPLTRADGWPVQTVASPVQLPDGTIVVASDDHYGQLTGRLFLFNGDGTPMKTTEGFRRGNTRRV